MKEYNYFNNVLLNELFDVIDLSDIRELDKIIFNRLFRKIDEEMILDVEVTLQGETK